MESVEVVENVRIEITKIDLDLLQVKGKDKAGKELVFYFGPDTKIRQITPVESVRPVGDARIQPLPFKTDDEVLVTWKYDRSPARKKAVKFTVLD